MRVLVVEDEEDLARVVQRTLEKVVEAHGGTIEAEDGPDGGAVLTIRLPSSGA